LGLLNRSCEGSDILLIYRGYVTHVNLYMRYNRDASRRI